MTQSGSSGVLKVDHRLPSVNDLCRGLILPEGIQEAEVRPATRRQQGESGPQGGGRRVQIPGLGEMVLSSLRVQGL